MTCLGKYAKLKKVAGVSAVNPVQEGFRRQKQELEIYYAVSIDICEYSELIYREYFREKHG